MNCLPVKSQGRTAMTSDFVTILDGPLEYCAAVWETLKETEAIKEEIEKYGEGRVRRAGAILDVSADGYYNSELCLKDFLKVDFFASFLVHKRNSEQAVDIGQANHGGKYTLVFKIDHSPIHRYVPVAFLLYWSL